MSPISNRLIVRTGPNPGMVFDITKEITTLGRDVTNDIVIGDPEVSRQHSRITKTPGGYVLEDMGSTNGTFINSERLSAPRVLREGDILGLSEKVTLTFEGLTPRAAETVMSQAAKSQQYSPSMREQSPSVAPSPVPVQPIPSHGLPPQITTEEPRRKKSSWLLAGCGCLVVIVVIAIFLWYLDANYPCLLYKPLELIGFDLSHLNCQ